MLFFIYKAKKLDLILEISFLQIKNKNVSHTSLIKQHT